MRVWQFSGDLSAEQREDSANRVKEEFHIENLRDSRQSSQGGDAASCGRWHAMYRGDRLTRNNVARQVDTARDVLITADDTKVSTRMNVEICLVL